MLTTISTKGQVVIPKVLRDAMGLGAGVSVEIEATPEGLLLRPLAKKQSLTIHEFLAMPPAYTGPPLSDADIDDALERDMGGRRA